MADLKYTLLMNMTKTKTITLELTPYEQETLLDALSAEVTKWLDIKCDYLLGNREERLGSYEGANILYNEAKGLRDKISELCNEIV